MEKKIAIWVSKEDIENALERAEGDNKLPIMCEPCKLTQVYEMLDVACDDSTLSKDELYSVMESAREIIGIICDDNKLYDWH